MLLERRIRRCLGECVLQPRQSPLHPLLRSQLNEIGGRFLRPEELLAQDRQIRQPLGTVKEGLHVSPAVEAVVMKGLAKKPEDRYPDVRAFAAALREAIAQPTAAATPARGATAGNGDEAAGLFGRLRGIFKRG